MRKMTRSFLLIGNIDGINFYVAGIEVHPHSYPISHFGRFNILKKCFVCEKISRWSTNYTQQEHKELKNQFCDRYSKYKARPGDEKTLQRWITDYESIEDNDKHVAMYF